MLVKENTAHSALLVQLGGVFLAIGLATSDIVEAIKRSMRS
jgi:hypothetical protein